MTVDVDEAILSGEPFKAGDRWFRCVCERLGEIRLTWGPTADWANWNPLMFWIIPDDQVPATILRVSAGEID
jgi:hypothetical protein